MKKAGIYNPYLDTMGGGERYALTVAVCLLKAGWGVDFFWNSKNERGFKKQVKERFGLDLVDICFVEDIFSSKKSLPKKRQITRRYDLIFYLSDGSIPFLFAKKNILHFQVPFHDIKRNFTLDKIKLRNINAIVCNSRFTKKFIDREYGVKSIVIYPPVAVDDFTPGRKEDVILSVGRFSGLMQAKRQDVLVDAFLESVEKFKGWRLVLAGGVGVGRGELLKKLKAKIKRQPAEIIENPPYKELKRLYSQAKIFWLASGFDIDEERQPEKVEHFGITTVEAMAAGCVPMVINKGGQPEIVADGQSGLLWNSKKELVDKTVQLIKNPKQWQKLSEMAQKRAQDFSQARFCQEIGKLAR